MTDIRPLSERELNDYLAACDGATDEELLDVKAPDGNSLRDILTGINAPADFSFTLTATGLHPETIALMTGMHPAQFERGE